MRATTPKDRVLVSRPLAATDQLSLLIEISPAYSLKIVIDKQRLKIEQVVNLKRKRR